MAEKPPFSNPILATFEQAFQHFPSGILWLDEYGEILGANQKICADLNYQKAELIGMMVFEINPHLNLLVWKKMWKKLQENRNYKDQVTFITSEEHLIPVNTDLILLPFAEGAFAMLIAENLMETQRLEDLMDVMARAGKVGGWELDLVKEEITLTGECQRLLHLEKPISVFNRSAFSQLITPFVSKQRFEELKQALTHSIKYSSSFDIELIFQPKEGDFRRLAVNGFPQQSELGQQIKIYGSVRDISSFETKSEQLYLTQFSIDHGQEMIFWILPNGDFIYANKKTCDSLGYVKEELLKLNMQDIAPAFDEQARDTLWEQLREQHYIKQEFQVFSKQGPPFPLTTTINYLQFKNKGFYCVFARDYSQRKKELERLRLSQFTLDNSGELVLWVDAEGFINYANKAFMDRTGYTQKDLKGIDIYTLYTNPNPKKDRQKLWEKLRKEKEIELEADLRAKDGTTIPVYCSLNYINFEGKELDCIFMRDWSGKKKRDKQLLLSKETFEKANDLIIWVNEAQKITFANLAASKILQFKPEELTNLPLSVVCKEKAVFEADQLDVNIETLLNTKNGQVIPVELSKSHITIDDHKIWCFIGRNISVRKKKEAELQAARKKVEELLLRLKDENLLLREEISSSYNFNNIITCSPKYRKVLDQVGKVAASTATVLILGETGTGKELLARAIHSLSDREDQPLIKVNCATLPENLIESELFGHVRGSFTGAVQDKKGRFLLANKGTIFLDEIGEIPLDMQAKLLRVLQEGEFEQLGGNKTIQVDVRIIAATNRPLAQMVTEGTFREDLYYRLNVFPIVNLPLRERKEDIPLLARHFTKKYGERFGKKINKIPQADLNQLKNYSFPGNIRELENMIERAIILSNGDTLNLKSSFDDRRSTAPSMEATQKNFLSFEDMQRQHILDALNLTGWRVTGPKGAGHLLGMNDRTLASKMRKLGLRREDYFPEI
ncbi:MAG: sigma 54-interacting transcriptional regulator [Saprospiraceae bacterium]